MFVVTGTGIKGGVHVGLTFNFLCGREKLRLVVIRRKSPKFKNTFGTHNVQQRDLDNLN